MDRADFEETVPSMDNPAPSLTIHLFFLIIHMSCSNVQYIIEYQYYYQYHTVYSVMEI